MDQMKNPKRLRREYLWGKCEAYGYVVFFIGLIAGTVACLVNNAVLYSQQGHRSYIVLVVLLGFCAIIHINNIRKVRVMLKTMAYVPPIDTHTLPVEEVLVRGSDAPSLQQSEALLRPARDQATEPQELLRSI